MLELVVEVLGADGATPLAGARVSGAPPAAGSDGLDADAPLSPADADGRFNVPPDGEFVVRVERADAPGLALQVALDLTTSRGPAFKHGTRPACMELTAARTGAGRPASFLLRVRWGEVQEVVFAAGTNDAARFAALARGRFARLARDGEVATSCVLTAFEFAADPPKGFPDATYRLRRRRYLVDAGHRASLTPGQLQAGRGALVLSQHEWTGQAPEISALSFYAYLAEVGRSRPGTVREVGFFSHAYWIGPVLLNTGRLPAHCSEVEEDWSRHRRCAVTTCHDHCPTDREHETLTRLAAPRLRDVDPPYGYLTPVDSSVRSYLNVTLSRRDPDHRGLGAHRRAPHDRDPRNTDFASPGMLPGAPLADMRAALHPEAILRVWGCNNGPLGPLTRAWRAQPRPDEPDRRLTLAATWERHGDPVRLRWRPRGGDLRLIYLSSLRRCYAQALAQALGRPCYGTVLGTYGEYVTTALGAMEARGAQLMAPHALAQLYPDGVSPGELTARDRRELRLAEGAAAPGRLVDPGGYVRFPPAPPRVRVGLTVLVTGFLPFRDASGRLAPFNSSGEVVRALAQLDVAARVHAPPWVDLALRVVTDPEVDVVWTCPAERAPAAEPRAPRASTAPGGAARILARAAESGADVVIIVGESQELTALGMDLRLERFAANVGNDKVPDNAGDVLRGEGPGWRDVEDHGQRFRAGPIFPGRDAAEVLESTIPLRAWLQCVARLRREPDALQLHNGPGTNITRSAGKFVCNESLFQLLVESREGTGALARPAGAPARPASGRWVGLVHVASQQVRRGAGGALSRVSAVDAPAREAHARLARAVGAVAASLVEELLWASDVQDLEMTHEGRTTPAPLRHRPQDWFQLTLRGEDGQPQAGVSVALTASDERVRRVTTDAQGVARWEGLPPGDVRFELPPGMTAFDPRDVDGALGPPGEAEVDVRA